MNISVVDGTPYIWSVKDACTLREKHRIVGTLVGCLPRCPAQNNHLGLPLQLLPEEAKLLLDKGICHLTDARQKRPKPTQQHLDEHERMETEIYKQQNEWAVKKRQEDMRRRRHEILEGKRKKKKLEEDAEKEEDQLEKIIQEESLTLPRERASVVIQTASLFPPTEPYAFDFPRTPLEILRYKVFRHLWELGHYLTTGGKFGGDFLCYPGDPSRFHALYVVVCVPPCEADRTDADANRTSSGLGTGSGTDADANGTGSGTGSVPGSSSGSSTNVKSTSKGSSSGTGSGRTETSLTGRQIAAYGRLANNVQKSMLLCSEDASGELCIVSLQWTGMS